MHSLNSTKYWLDILLVFTLFRLLQGFAVAMLFCTCMGFEGRPILILGYLLFIDLFFAFFMWLMSYILNKHSLHMLYCWLLISESLKWNSCCVGQTLNISCGTDSEKPIGKLVLWKRNGELLPSSDRILNQERFLIIAPIEKNDQATYTCRFGGTEYCVQVFVLEGKI